MIIRIKESFNEKGRIGMARTYRGVFNNSQDNIEDIISNILVDVTEIHRIATTIRDEDANEKTIQKIEEIECMAGHLMYELE